MDEERQETADWRIVWQMFFPCVISDLIGGCVEALGHLHFICGKNPAYQESVEVDAGPDFT